MRTTVTLGPDVASKLKAVARERGVSFKEALNSAVRADLGGERRARSAFKQYSQPMGLRAGFNLDKALQLATALEDQEVVRRFELRK
jgi:hypothetical protein